MDKVYMLDKEAVISALSSGARVYYVERAGQEVYEFTVNDPIKDLANAVHIFAVKKG